MSTTSTFTSIAYSTANTQLLAANSNRRGATIWNNGTTGLNVSLGLSGSSQPNLVVPVNGYYEVPFSWTGVINGAWAAGGAGSAWVVELLP